MRKLLVSFLCVVFMAGLVIAAEVTMVKFDKDKKELTVKDDKDKETTYKLTDKIKYSTAGKGGDKDLKYEDIEKALSNEKAVGRKMDITVEKGEITELKLKGRGKKNN